MTKFMHNTISIEERLFFDTLKIKLCKEKGVKFH